MAQAEAGADVVAPSGMMDGQVAAIRDALDEAEFAEVAILAYGAKYASALYGPFREAVDVTIVGGGDRKAYQQDPRNAREALEEIRADLAEGADMVMVKPALAYLDVLAHVRAEVDVPLAAYHVSGEYAMVKAAAERGWIDGPAVMLEHLTAIRRAGADMILTYAARDVDRPPLLDRCSGGPRPPSPRCADQASSTASRRVIAQVDRPPADVNRSRGEVVGVVASRSTPPPCGRRACRSRRCRRSPSRRRRRSGRWPRGTPPRSRCRPRPRRRGARRRCAGWCRRPRITARLAVVGDEAGELLEVVGLQALVLVGAAGLGVEGVQVDLAAVGSSR